MFRPTVARPQTGLSAATAKPHPPHHASTTSTMELKEDYKNVPHKGGFFTENGITYYWTQSNVKPGTQLKTKQRAWASTGPMEVGVVTEPTQLPCFDPNSMPVYPVAIFNPGFYYEIDRQTTAIENQVIDGHCYTKWRVDYPLGGAAQSALALSSQSNEEYEIKKQAALEAT